jgi:hypothetical protein
MIDKTAATAQSQMHCPSALCALLGASHTAPPAMLRTPPRPIVDVLGIGHPLGQCAPLRIRCGGFYK